MLPFDGYSSCLVIYVFVLILDVVLDTFCGVKWKVVERWFCLLVFVVVYFGMYLYFLLFCHVFLSNCVCRMGTPVEDGILTRWWRILIRSKKMVMMAMVEWAMSIDGLIENFRIFLLM